MLPTSYQKGVQYILPTLIQGCAVNVLMNDDNQRPKWLDDIEELANKQLGDLGPSSCKQIHPIIERWYDKLMEDAPPASRDSVLQAIACLSTEIIFDMSDDLAEMIEDDDHLEAELAYWVQEILMIGRAFQIALDKGDLDDL